MKIAKICKVVLSSEDIKNCKLMLSTGDKKMQSSPFEGSKILQVVLSLKIAKKMQSIAVC